MKKRVCLFCCVVGLLLPTTAHGETVQASQNDLPQVLWVEDYRDLYITQPSSVKEFCDSWEQWWKTGKTAELGYGEQDYKVTLYENENLTAAAKKNYLMYERQNKIAVEYLSRDSETGKLIRTKEVVSVSPEIMGQIVQKLEGMYETYYLYDTFDMMRGVDLAKINELGMVLNEDVYVFQNAFIDADGTLQVSLEDWNTIFATQYGEMKNLIYQNGAIKNNVLPTNIPCQNINGKVYIPLREAVNHFGHLTMEWDKQKRKAVVMEKAVFEKQQEYWSEVEKAAESLK
ncbi:hypothetical protein [Anaerotignum lactatifermentans]|uniref:hypothetical protein n=1 Tax=Anaerotignum lactatifermentans TaxID=160404 RepID=UPI0026156907|nr:hypothetical protein [Anaerotignum lactatifermentans]